MIVVLARKLIYLLSILHITITDRTHVLNVHCLLFLKQTVLSLSQPLRDAPHTLLELKQFFVCHVVGVNLYTVLIAHTNYHVPQVLHIHGSDLLIYFIS